MILYNYITYCAVCSFFYFLAPVFRLGVVFCRFGITERIVCFSVILEITLLNVRYWLQFLAKFRPLHHIATFRRGEGEGKASPDLYGANTPNFKKKKKN